MPTAQDPSEKNRRWPKPACNNTRKEKSLRAPPQAGLLQADLETNFTTVWLQLCVSYQKPKKLRSQTSGF
jgi:hypothetical protein